MGEGIEEKKRQRRGKQRQKGETALHTVMFLISKGCILSVVFILAFVIVES